MALSSSPRSRHSAWSTSVLLIPLSVPSIVPLSTLRPKPASVTASPSSTAVDAVGSAIARAVGPLRSSGEVSVSTATSSPPLVPPWT